MAHCYNRSKMFAVYPSTLVPLQKCCALKMWQKVARVLFPIEHKLKERPNFTSRLTKMFHTQKLIGNHCSMAADMLDVTNFAGAISILTSNMATGSVVHVNQNTLSHLNFLCRICETER